MAREIYGPVNGARKKAKAIYGSLNGARVAVTKVYGPVNGERKLVWSYDEQNEPWGVVEYKASGGIVYTKTYTLDFVEATYSQSGAASLFTALKNAGLRPSTDGGVEKILVSLPAGTYSSGEIPDGTVLQVYGSSYSSRASYTYRRSNNQNLKISCIAQITFQSAVDILAFTRDEIYSPSAATITHTLTQTEFESYSNYPVGFTLDGGAGFIRNTLITSFTFGSLPTSIDNGFLKGATHLTSLSPLPFRLTSIGNEFLYKCSSFNQALKIPNRVTTIGNSFLSDCTSFDQDIVVPDGVTTIGNYFFASCTSLNHSITLPDSLTSIGYGFLQRCTSYNKPLTLPSGALSISSQFLDSCSSFAQPLVIPSNVTLVSTGSYLSGLNSFVGPLEVHTDLSNIPATNLKYTLAVKSSTAPAYVNGVTITGPYASAWKTALDNAGVASGNYRNLILGN